MLEVYYDIETLTVNRQAKPSEQQAVEYVVAIEYDLRSRHIVLEFANLYHMLEYLQSLKRVKIKLIAHNGDRYDNHFLRRALIDYYGLQPLNAYNRNAITHNNETSIKSLEGDYLLESRVKSKTNLALNFRLGRTTYITEDSYPKFQASIATLGMLLFHAGIVDEKGEKLDYDYTKYDLKEKLSPLGLRAYAKNVYDSLTKHDHQYVHNDTNILYLAYKHYKSLFHDFDVSKRTLSQNILAEYLINDESSLQLINKVGNSKINYTDFQFGNENVFEYIHHFYNGGLNFYNDKMIGKTQKDIVHIDINSSYPNVMSNYLIPTYLIEAGINRSKDLMIDDKYYYMVKMTKNDFNKIIKSIKSINIRKMLVKYFNNSTDYVYLETPALILIGKFLGHKINTIRCSTYFKWEARPFAAKSVIDMFYQQKVSGKKQGWSKGEIYVTKVKLNGIYGIPALRAFFNIFRYDKIDNRYYNDINGFKNTERNIAFAGSITAWAFYVLLEPMTHNVSGIDKGFVYTDTDSLFLKREYFDTIKDNIKFDKFELGAWDIEHEQVDKMNVLNHKKYAIYSNGEITVHAGGITENTFKTEMPYEKFIETQFHDGAVLSVKKHTLNNDMVMIIYDAETVIRKGSTYREYYDEFSGVDYDMVLDFIREDNDRRENDDEEPALYYETPVGAVSVSEAYPAEYDNEYTFDVMRLINIYNTMKGMIG